MASLSHTYTDSSIDIQAAEPRARFGGSRRGPPTAARYERDQHYGVAAYHGSHMPLDIAAHWDWRNPLNILPALILLVLVIGLVAMVLV
ncbi:MAG: hypothetical protein ACJ8CR_01850 [Roseiflexaceae bacterium]